MSRRGVAAMAGVSHSTLHGWLERGRANPQEEPWGSFARDFLHAERGLEAAAAGTMAMVVGQLYRLAKAGDWDTLFQHAQLKELVALLQARWPEDWGASAWRKPEQEPDGAAWLERMGLQSEQLRALLRDPPPELRNALVAEREAILALLDTALKP